MPKTSNQAQHQADRLRLLEEKERVEQDPGQQEASEDPGAQELTLGKRGALAERFAKHADRCRRGPGQAAAGQGPPRPLAAGGGPGDVGPRAPAGPRRTSAPLTQGVGQRRPRLLGVP